MSKTHFRKAYKSDHLGVPDLEEFKENGSNLIFTIKEVRFKTGERVIHYRNTIWSTYERSNYKWAIAF